ncbi:MAG: hypothetical protein RLY13_78 [Actinomycetota bacterium]|jgi:hypothetical protein
MNTERDLLAQRYGRNKNTTKRNRTLIVVFGSFALAIFLAWAIWVTIAGAARVTTQDLGYQVLSPQQTSVKFNAQLPLGHQSGAVCAVQVLNQGFVVVGYRELQIDTSGVYETFVNTTELGVSGHIDKCWLK